MTAKPPFDTITNNKHKPSVQQTVNIAEIFDQLEGLELVSERIVSKLESEHPLLQEISEYLFSIGGKRLRPALALMVAQSFSLDTDDQRLIDIAAGIELIHMATLLHDDIIDHSPLRRQHVSPYAKYGTASTLLAGDFLLVRAFALCARLSPEIIIATERACVHLTEGEIAESTLADKVPSLEDYYYQIASKKTAALFALGAYCAAHLAGLRKHECESLQKFGQDLGIAFQILDDILDVTSDERTLGKQPGTDIRERKPSVVNLFWLKSGDATAQRLLTPPSTDSKAVTEEDFIEQALNQLRTETGGPIDRCRAEAQRFALSAQAHLYTAAQSSSLAVPEYIKQLDLLITYTLNRIF